MIRLTVFCSCVLLVALVAAFAWDYSHTKNQLTQARADLATAQTNVAQCVAARQSADAYAATLRGQASASQQNCAQTLLTAQSLHELALPPQPFTVSESPDMGLGMGSGTDATAERGAAGASVAPSTAPKPVSAPVNNQPAGGTDAAFTNFLNAW